MVVARYKLKLVCLVYVLSLQLSGFFTQAYLLLSEYLSSLNNADFIRLWSCKPFWFDLEYITKYLIPEYLS